MSGTLTLSQDLEHWTPSVGIFTSDQQLHAQEVGDSTGVDTPLVGTRKREEDFRKCLVELENYLSLPRNWDKYGGIPIEPLPYAFALNLLNTLQATPGISAPIVRPISGGVFLEWRYGKTILYFEVDEESALRFSRSAFGEESVEDKSFDVDTACQAVVDFHKSAA